MKKFKFLSLFALLTLTSCSLFPQNRISSLTTSNNGSSSLTTSPTSSLDNETSSSSSLENQTSSLSSLDSSSSSESSSSSNQTSSSEIILSDRSISLYGINDFHGAVNASSSELGIVKLGTYLKNKKQEGNTLLLNSGDYFQGSIESNYNRGALLTDCMNYIEFDCFTLGNHEFDWGVNYINANRNRINEDTSYQTPFLASNIYQFDITTKTVGEYASLGEPYTIRTLENGLRVGIIGIIGTEQITSITSQNVDDLSFVDQTQIVKSLSDQLRCQEGVDVVILDAHTDQNTITGSSDASDTNGLTLISETSNKRYVDAVFCGHTHTSESEIVNGVPFVQTNGYGRGLGNIELKVSSKGEVTCARYEIIEASDIYVKQNDATLTSLVNQYGEESSSASNQKLAKVSGYLSSTEALPNLVCTALYDYASSLGYNVAYTMTNNARYSIATKDLTSSYLTYGTLFRALPFDNEVYIIEVTGKSLAKEIKYNYIYRADSAPLDTSKNYTIAVIDYLATHRNSSRDYDYFDIVNIVGKLSKDGEDIYNYREITKDYIITNFASSTLYASNFSSSSDVYNRDNVTSSI